MGALEQGVGGSQFSPWRIKIGEWRVAEAKRWSCRLQLAVRHAGARPLGRRRAEAGQAASVPGPAPAGTDQDSSLQERGRAGAFWPARDGGRDADAGRRRCGRDYGRNGMGDAEKRNREQEGRASGRDGLTGDGALTGGKPRAGLKVHGLKGGLMG